MSGLGQLVVQSLRRNLRHNVLASIGVVVGIAAFAFFLGLDGGVRQVVQRIFPVDRIAVIPPKASLFGGTRSIDDSVVDKLRQPPPEIGVRPKAVFPRLTLSFPARGWGGRNIIGKDLHFEVSGFCEGVSPKVLAGEVQRPFVFADNEAKDAAGRRCTERSHCEKGRYCATDLARCVTPVPTIISPYMIELYNGTIAKSHPHLPRIPDFVSSVFAGRLFTVELGRSYLGATARRGGPPIRRVFQLVGVSDKASPIGLTVPLGYVKRWNKRFVGKAAARDYAAAVVVVGDKSEITPMATYARSLGFDLAENRGEQLGVFITVITLLFALVSFVIVGIAAINISHTFMMLIGERRREIGILRAVGATRWHVRAVVLAEALVVGLGSGVLGMVLAVGAGAGVDWYSRHHVVDFPFKPDTYFVFTPGLLSASLGFAVLFCLLGALAPANRAAKLEPAVALSSR